MFELNSRSYRTVSSLVIYLIAIAAALTIATMHSRAKATAVVSTAPAPGSHLQSGKPFFSLSTHRTFATNETPRLWVNYHGVDHLDFRVYQVQDPARLLAQLSNPHQMGESEQESIAGAYKNRPSLLEYLRSIKRTAYATIKSYVRSQVQRSARESFNHHFRKPEELSRTPLNVSDYARVPLLNPSALVSSWREPLPFLEDDYDQRPIPLGKRAAGVYLVEAVAGDLRAYTIAVVTDLSLLNKTTRTGELLVYTVDRNTGEPRGGASIDVIKDRKTIATGVTDAGGILHTGIDKEILKSEANERQDDASDGRSFIITAKHQNNFAISDLESFYFLGYEGEAEEESNLKGYVYTERPIYRPAQKIFFKGIVRSIDQQGAYGAVQDQTAHVTVEDPNNSSVFDQDIQISSRGTFNGVVEVGEGAPLGSYRINAEFDEGTINGSFEVAEYKKPEYKVKISTPQQFVPAGGKTTFSIDARYFFGAPVANADVKYYIYRSRYYAWVSDDHDEMNSDEDEPGYSYGGGDMLQESEGKLDAHGHLNVDFQVPQSDRNETFDYSYRIDADVVDQSRRSISGNATFVATRGTTITTANPDRYVYDKGAVAKIRVSTTDYEGRPVSATVQLHFVEQTWTTKSNDNSSYPSYEMHERELGSATVQTNLQGMALYDYTTSEPGHISIKTIIKEGGNEVASLGGYLWVTDEEYPWSDSSYYSEDYGSIKLVPDKKSYRPGETAHVLAILPTGDAHLLVSTELSRIVSAWQVNVPGRSAVLDVPIQAAYAPDIFLNVSYIKEGELYTTDKRLNVPASDKLLNLEIISNKKEYKPRETASYTVLARNANGAPVSGVEVSLGIVDEAIYSLAPEQTLDIRQEFYGRRYNEVNTYYSVSYTFTGYAGDKPLELARNKPSYQLADFKNDGDMVEPVIRNQFKDTAYWQPNAVTGADGKATVKVKFPDNLTTWRATARGITSDTKVGSTTYKVVARKDVILRLETPRFITEGDTLTLSGIVHNYLKTDKATQISLQLEGAELLGEAKQTVTIPKEGEHRIDWQISAPQAGHIKLLAKALTNTESDAVELPLEVVPKGLHQVLNQSWVATDDNAEKSFAISLPGNADTRARTLRIEASPSIASSLFGALDYLTTYPYGCTEQTMSSFLPNVVVAEAVKDVKTASIRKGNDLSSKVTKGMNRLYGFQHNDGGWGWWKDDQSDPFMTAYVIDGLTQARHAGYPVDEGRMTLAREKLQQMVLSGKTEAGTEIDYETRSLMVYSLASSGTVDSDLVERAYRDRNNLQPYGRALLALTLKLTKREERAREVAMEIERDAVSDGNSSHWESRRKHMLDFAEENDVEATALSLKALSRIKPDSPILGLVARWLVSQRPNGYYWGSTKDTAFAISGLIDYLKVSRELSPDYDLEVYVNGETVAAQHVSSAAPLQSIVINRGANAVSTINQVKVVKRGKGSLYFTTSLDFYTGEETVAAQGSSDLNLTREYLRLRVVEDGYKLKWTLEPLTGEIHSGDLLVARLRLTGAKARHVMIEDPIPAGAEQVDKVGNINLDHTANDWSDWYSSREFRDQRTVFFLDYFDGAATFQYALRVQVPGDFRVAPARTELMYRPEIHANTESGHMLFLDRN